MKALLVQSDRHFRHDPGHCRFRLALVVHPPRHHEWLTKDEEMLCTFHSLQLMEWLLHGFVQPPVRHRVSPANTHETSGGALSRTPAYATKKTERYKAFHFSMDATKRDPRLSSTALNRAVSSIASGGGASSLTSVLTPSRCAVRAVQEKLRSI